jgi:hypothetical protein
MADKAAIVDTIQQGTDQVRRTFGSLSDEQLRTKIHEGERGWTARDVLAHLAARQAVNDRLLRMASGDAAPIAAIPSMDDWNQTLIDARRASDRDTLLAEFQAVQDALIAQVQTLSDDQLARPVPLPQGEMLLGDLLGMAGGAHAGHHAQEVEQAIARAAVN